jgi:hypothetical protein
MLDDSTPDGRAGTGDPRVDAVVDRLGRVDDLPLEEHVPVYEDLHDELRQVLSELDTGPAGPAGPQGHPRPSSPAGR